MKRTFFYFTILFIGVAIAGYIAWLLADGLYSLYKDRKLAKELDELEAWAGRKRNDADAASIPPADRTPADRTDDVV